MMLRTKLLTAFLGAALLVAGFGAVSLAGLEIAQNTYEDDGVAIAEKEYAFREMYHAVNLATMNAFLYHHTGNDTARQEAVSHLDTIQNQEPRFTRHAAEEQANTITTANTDLDTTLRDVIAADPGDEEALAALPQISDPDSDVMQAYYGVREDLEAEMYGVIDAITGAFTRAEQLILIAMFLNVIFATALGLLLSNHISRPLHELQTTVDRISKGDMTATLSNDLKTRNDEIGFLSQSFDRTLTSLKLAMHRTAPKLEEEVKEKEKTLTENRALLTATINAVSEGLLVVDYEGHILYYNTAFLDMWDIPEDLAASADDETLLSHATDHLKNPQKFREKVEYLYAHPEEESQDRLEFTDGRVFKRFSQPVYLEDQNIGRVWRFQDISEEE